MKLCCNNLILIKILLLVFIQLTTCKFPDDPKPCKYGDTECIEKILTYFLTEKTSGDPSINLINLNPLAISKIGIKQGEENPVNIDLVFTNTHVTGIDHPTDVHIKGFGKDLKKKNELIFGFESLSMNGGYTMNGRVLILPVSGSGNSTITMYKPKIRLSFSGMPVEKDDGVYMKIDKIDLNMAPKKMHFNFENLFNGDKVLGDNLNLFLNENWTEIYKEVRDSTQSAFAKIFESVINNVFSKYPYDKYFIE